MTDLLSRFTDYKNDKRKDSQIVQTIKNKNFTNKELKELQATGLEAGQSFSTFSCFFSFLKGL